MLDEVMVHIGSIFLWKLGRQSQSIGLTGISDDESLQIKAGL
jgi:hypothetical protein